MPCPCEACSSSQVASGYVSRLEGADSCSLQEGLWALRRRDPISTPHCMPVQVRLKVKDWFSVRLLPHQVFKVNKRWQLGASPVALRVNYECPLDNLANPLAAPAKLMVR